MMPNAPKVVWLVIWLLECWVRTLLPNQGENQKLFFINTADLRVVMGASSGSWTHSISSASQGDYQGCTLLHAAL
jgi:hypothetical protein